MSETRDLLIEIGTEELPPKALRRLSEAFAEGLGKGLAGASLKPGRTLAYATPRRLALLIKDLPVAQKDSESVRRGPALAAAFDEEQAISQIATLTGPPYFGRLAGSEGGFAAGNYIAEQFSTLGLQPAGEGGEFFQSFEVPFAPMDVGITLES